MKPFNLEEALAGHYCVTRSGNKAKVLVDTTGTDDEIEYPLIGVVHYKGMKIHSAWSRDGFISKGEKRYGDDIVGMYEERQPEVTITIPAPLKVAEEGQEVWYLNYDVTNVHGVTSCKTYPEKELFTRVGSHLVYLLETGQLFKTKEDAQAWLDAMKGARQ